MKPQRNVLKGVNFPEFTLQFIRFSVVTEKLCSPVFIRGKNPLSESKDQRESEHHQDHPNHIDR